MNHPEHLQEAVLRYQYAVDARDAGDLIGAGEFVWLAVVHAISAADPDHELPNPDAFQNPHPAPNTERTYNLAKIRITTPAFSRSDFERCLHITQRQLHNNAYHLTLSRTDLVTYIRTGLDYADRLIQIARTATAPTPSPGGL